MLIAMDAVFQYEIPVLHPLAVHFPLALLLAAAMTALVWCFRGTFFWRQSTLLLTALGTIGAALAYTSGDAMEEQSEGVPIVEDLVGLHEEMGLYTLIVSAAATIVLVVFAIVVRRTNERRDPILARVMVACLVFLAAALVAWTAHIGATMTWGVVAP